MSNIVIVKGEKTEFIIEGTPEQQEVPSSGRSQEVRETSASKVPESAIDVIDSVGNLLEEIATRLADSGSDAVSALGASEGEIEFSIGFNAKFSLWVLNASSENSLKVRFTWK